MNGQARPSNVLRTSTLVSLGLTVILLLAFPSVSTTSSSQSFSGDSASTKASFFDRAILRMLLKSQRQAQRFVSTKDCAAPTTDETVLNRLILMSYLEREIVAEKSFSSILRMYPHWDIDRDDFSARPNGGNETIRGKDCDDWDSETHPMLGGNRSSGSSQPIGIEHDYNCNGIFGVDPLSGLTYDDEYCTSFKDDRSLLVFGDSWASGFSLDAACLDGYFRQCMQPGLKTIFNFPEQSYLTGFDTTSSLYLEMLRRNRCAHRQWANMATPGARMKDFVRQVGRYDVAPGKPSLVVVQFAMNDVCGDSPSDMTNPEDFQANLLNGLNRLDMRVGNGSRVLLMGLINGRQYDLMWNGTHPISSYLGNATYADVYDYWSCTGMNPCPTFLSSDPNWRNAATQRSLELDGVLEYVTRNYKFNNFLTVYVDTDDVINRGVEKMVNSGIEPHEFFNSFDGFHPSLEHSSFLADALIEVLEMRFPGYIGQKNPNNDAIIKQFKDQGGY